MKFSATNLICLMDIAQLIVVKYMSMRLLGTREIIMFDTVSNYSFILILEYFPRE